MTDSAPGFGAIKETEEAQIWGTGPDNNHQRFHAKGTVDSTATDTGNTGYTTTLRAGNVLGLKDSDSNLYLYDADANDGTQKVVGLLEKYLYMGDRDGTVEDKHPKILLGGLIKSVTDVLGEDLHALAVLLRRGFHLMDLEPHGSYFGVHWKTRYFKSADYTLLAADHGCEFIATAAVNFTLPSLAAVSRGYQVYLQQAANTNLVVTGAADTIVYDDTAGGLATTLTWSTANQKMGAAVLMVADYVSAGGALAWFPRNIQRTVVAA